MFSDAKDYETAFLSVDRESAQGYYYGLSPGMGPYAAPYAGEDPTATLGEILNQDDKDQPNRSTYVSTDVRDAMMMMLPSLIRLFGASESPVFLVPRTEAEVDQAEQATDYVNYVFWNDNPGFLNLYGAIKDALTVKTGFLKWWSEDHQEMKRKRFQNVSADQIQMILSEDPTARILEIGKPVKSQSARSPSGAAAATSRGAAARAAAGGPTPRSAGGWGPARRPDGWRADAQLPPALTAPPPPVYDHVVIEYEVKKPLIKVAGVPPEEMRLDRYARSFATAASSATSGSCRSIS